MRAPAFWWRPRPTWPANLLRPAGWIYGSVTGRRMRRTGERAALPVICIGNFTVGGAGKTPTALAVAAVLEAAGESPAFLSRGYGGHLRGPVQVQPQHGATDVGDEPMLLAAAAPAIVAAERPAGARLASEIGATVLIMDDGLQNPSLRKDCALAVVDGATGIGNGLPLPAGPLRAPMKAQWPAVDAVLVIGQGAAGETVAQQAEALGKRVFRGRLAPDPTLADTFGGRRVLAFAGIGRPEKFFETLRACGAIVEETRAFPDHHPYNRGELESLRREAEARGVQAVTTEKDLVRIGGSNGPGAWSDLMVLPVRLQLDDKSGFRNFILRRIGDRRLSRP
ncbi:tetraacyldisaccharide 4'-kinase [Microvirga makkahensis]|uniref:Tetraacyldisaccharide 4'-kinase n=1 Tax=Microvirga makkahensis TaxID=1128670 RepID=A0A7X3MXC4_9HYPH|nr:tetraacyldisaccharide 4'-kinase [Microvirga makkahensis]MXQ14773.1 tetraacyldisaccharide 4'-kinase [Microvirga makkahensis]